MWAGGESEADPQVDDRVDVAVEVLLEREVVDDLIDDVERPHIVEGAANEVTSEPAVRSDASRADAASPEPAVEAEVGAAPAPKARITIRGADRVRLLGVGAPRAPGEVPPGTYEVEATFGDRVVPGAGRVTVRAGQQVELSCDADFGVCE